MNYGYFRNILTRPLPPGPRTGPQHNAWAPRGLRVGGLDSITTKKVLDLIPGSSAFF